MTHWEDDWEDDEEAGGDDADWASVSDADCADFRSQLAKHMRRSELRDDIWEDLTDSRHISEWVKDWKGADLRQQYRVLEEAAVIYRRKEKRYPNATKRGPSQDTKPRDIPPDKRLWALSQILAIEAGKRPDVASFREEVLGGKLLAFEDIEPWIEQQRQQQGNPTVWVTVPLPEGTDILRISSKPTLVELGKLHGRFATDLLPYLITGDEWVHYVPVRHGSPLGRLYRIVKSDLSKVWSEAVVTLFVLTGIVPPIPKARVRMFDPAFLPLLQHCPNYIPMRIRLDVDPRMSKDEVGKFYAKARKQLFPGDDKPMSDKHLQLGVFLAEHGKQGTWEATMDAWNVAHAEWCYTNYRNYCRDAKRAYERITGRQWKED